MNNYCNYFENCLQYPQMYTQYSYYQPIELYMAYPQICNYRIEFGSNLEIISKENISEVKTNETSQEVDEVAKELVRLLETNIKEKNQANNEKEKERCRKLNDPRSMMASRKNLTKYWGKKLKQILLTNSNNLCQDQQEISALVEKLTSRKLVMEDINQIFEENIQIMRRYVAPMLQENKLHYDIFNDSKKKDEVKIAMIESIPVIKEVLFNNRKLKSWALKNDLKTKTVIEIKFENKSYKQILEQVNIEYEKARAASKNQKEQSKFKNLTHFWIQKIKQAIKEYELDVKIEENELFEEASRIIKEEQNLQTIKKLFKNSWVCQIIMNKITDNSILLEILRNNRLNLLNKKNMMETYPVFKNAIEGKIEFVSWVMDKNKPKVVQL